MSDEKTVLLNRALELQRLAAELSDEVYADEIIKVMRRLLQKKRLLLPREIRMHRCHVCRRIVPSIQDIRVRIIRGRPHRVCKDCQQVQRAKA